MTSALTVPRIMVETPEQCLTDRPRRLTQVELTVARKLPVPAPPKRHWAHGGLGSTAVAVFGASQGAAAEFQGTVSR